jgi:hypothetical protein
LFVAAGLVLALAGAAQAQTTFAQSPVSQLDVTGVIGWMNGRSDVDQYDGWYNRSVYGGGGVGWYWTDNLKTEIDGGVSSPAERNLYRTVVVANRYTSSESRYTYSTRRFSVGQQYQFRRNAWFHPFLAAGLDMTWEKTEREDQSVTVYDSTTRLSQTIIPATVYPASTDLLARPFGTLGFKAYMSQRSFFRMDLKFVVKDGVEEVLLRFGLGTDF